MGGSRTSTTSCSRRQRPTRARERIVIRRLEEAPTAAAAVGRWIHNLWGELPISRYFDDLSAGRPGHARLPQSFVAFAGPELVGTISILRDDLETRPEFDPWVGCLFVADPYRRRGVGAALLRAAEQHAFQALKIRQLYLFTENHAKLYERHGWRHIESDTYRGKQVAIMRKDPSLPTVSENWRQRGTETRDLDGAKARLALEFLKRAHVSMWACDEEFKIVLWNPGAEEIYQISEADALGKNYLELFVAELERDQSKEDCLRVIREEGYRQVNCIALDETPSRRAMKEMLTNVFRIQDPDTGRYLQAEIGIDIKGLDGQRIDNERTRKAAASRQEEKQRLLHLLDQETASVKRSFQEERKKLREYAKQQTFMREAVETALRDIDTKERRAIQIINGIAQKTRSASSLDELQNLRQDLAKARDVGDFEPPDGGWA